MVKSSLFITAQISRVSVGFMGPGQRPNTSGSKGQKRRENMNVGTNNRDANTMHLLHTGFELELEKNYNIIIMVNIKFSLSESSSGLNQTCCTQIYQHQVYSNMNFSQQKNRNIDGLFNQTLILLLSFKLAETFTLT